MVDVLKVVAFVVPELRMGVENVFANIIIITQNVTQNGSILNRVLTCLLI